MKNTLFILILTILLTIPSITLTSAEVITDGLVSYWTFDKIDIINDTAKDVWGENNATIHGDPNTATGIVGEAFKFDGKNDYVDLTTLGDFGEQLGKSTFEAWIRTTNTTDWMTLINTNGHLCPNWGIQINARKTKDALVPAERMLSFNHSLTDGKQCFPIALGDYSPVFDGKWHHIVYILDFEIDDAGGRGQERVYINSIRRPRSTTNVQEGFGFFPFTAPIILGARKLDDTAVSFFKGYIDEVRIYDRPLTENQIIKNYAARTQFSVHPKQKLTTFWGSLKQ